MRVAKLKRRKFGDWEGTGKLIWPTDAGTWAAQTGVVAGLVHLMLVGWGDVLCPKLRDSAAKLVGGTVIWDNDICVAAFFLGWPLGGLAIVEIGLGPASGCCPLQSQFTG